MLRFRLIDLALMVTCLLFSGWSADQLNGQTGWYPRVIAPPAQREIIKNTPIHLRPNRPLHFYGNTVRRQYYRSNPAIERTQVSPSVLSTLSGSSVAPGPANQPEAKSSSSILEKPAASAVRPVPKSRQDRTESVSSARMGKGVNGGRVLKNPENTSTQATIPNRSNPRRFRLLRRR